MRLLKGLLAAALIAAAVLALTLAPAPRDPLPQRSGPRLADATTWGYQLQGARADRIAASFDVLVIDHSRDGSQAGALSPEDVMRFRQRPDGSQRIVLAYLSIGEAETYRYYWWRHWRTVPPSWLAAENKDWKGNFLVRYWEPAWQRIIVQSGRSLLDRLLEWHMSWRKPYLDRILEAGFDGVYLDRVDAFDEWGKHRQSAEADMRAFIATISAYAKARRPGFLIVPQNGEELLRDAAYRRLIDGVAKEDLLFGAEAGERQNPAKDVTQTVLLLNRARGDGLPVLVVEYLANPAKQLVARQRVAELGFVLQIAKRELDQPPMGLPPLPPPAPAASTAPNVRPPPLPPPLQLQPVPPSPRR